MLNEALKDAILHLERAKLALGPLLESKELDRSERSNISSQVNSIEQQIALFKHYVEVGFVDY